MNSSFENIFDFWIQQKRNESSQEKASNEIVMLMHELNHYNSTFARAFTAYIRARISHNPELAQAVVSWITGEKNVPSRLKAQFDVIGHIDKHNAIDFLRAFSRLVYLLGYHGLVILVDELEYIMHERSDLRHNAYDNLRHLIDQSYGGKLPHCLFVFAGTPELFDNGEKGIVSHEALNQRLGRSIERVRVPGNVEDIRQPVLTLKPFDKDQLQHLTNSILTLYQKAYDFTPGTDHASILNWTLFELKKATANANSLKQSASTGNEAFSVREYITKLIEVLDLLQQHPEKLKLTRGLNR